MNCNNDITQYIGSSTFQFDNITYNKVKVTKDWNRLGVRYFNNATKEVRYYNVYEIPVGEYSHTELFTAIYNCLKSFCTYTGIINVTAQTRNPATSGNNYPFPSKSYSSFSNRFKFTGEITNGGDIYVDIVAVPKGIQEILPFTLPMPFVHSRNAEYNSRNSYDNRFSDKIQIFNSGYFFDMIWLNPLFFYHKEVNCQYPNNFTAFACNYKTTSLFSDVKTGEPSNYVNTLFTIPPGVYSEYGYIIALLVCFCNSQAVGREDSLRFIIYEEDGKINIQRSQADNKWSIPISSISVNRSFAGYTVRDFSESDLFRTNQFILDTSLTKKKYLNYANNKIISNYNSNLCLHNNKFISNYNINPIYIQYEYNRIKYN